MNKLYLVSAFVIISIFACSTSKSNSANKESKKSLTYLALGDSYTIGEAVAKEKSFPYQLSEQINARGIEMQAPKIIAKTGWRTDELLLNINKEKSKYDLVSVLIGVNNQYQGKEVEQFKKEFTEILEKATQLSKTGEKGVFVFSIPDYSVTPFARNKKTKKIAKEILLYNKYCKLISEEKNIQFYNITTISKQAKEDTRLLADDKLHPSAKMYNAWVEKWVGTIIDNHLK